MVMVVWGLVGHYIMHARVLHLTLPTFKSDLLTSKFALKFPVFDLYTFIFVALFSHAHWILPHILHYQH